MTTPNMQPVFEEFYAKAEALAQAAKALDADAAQRSTALTAAEQQDVKDRAALAQLEQQVAALQAKVDAQAERLEAQRAELKAVEDDRDQRKAMAEEIVAIVEREKDRLANELKPSLTLLPGAASAAPEPEVGPAGVTLRDPLPGRPIGAIESCPGCRQPISWDGLRWTHGTVTDCTADLSAVSPQQDGVRS